MEVFNGNQRQASENGQRWSSKKVYRYQVAIANLVETSLGFSKRMLN
jgi:hypothetical protein